MEGFASKSEQGGDSGQPARGMLWVLSQFVLAPLAVFVYGLELIVRTAHKARRTAEQSVELMAGPQPKDFREPVTAASVKPEPPPEGPPAAAECTGRAADKRIVKDVVESGKPGSKEKENTSMQDHEGATRRDRDLHDDMLKLVRYKILFVRREYEHAFPEREDLVYDSMDGTAFAAWKVAEFIQELGKEKTPVPDKWRDKGYPKSSQQRNGMLTGLDDEDKKYLRVYFEVLERYPREKFKYEEEQIDILRKMLHKLGPPQPGSASAADSGSADAPAGSGSTGVSSGGGSTDRGLGYTPR